ncbi:hypothetical protein [Bosea sp. RAC05]|uniref:hypothetical protein n=1 Tax=Bosea sp. RAC05 TaxID=1842539 RepID=UPI00083DFF57|nr:hypothetical protein [Bosea sp. RAC05]AOG03407.1 hypothetical protein BSY19_5051 [Bosea sp. RAC05]
MFEEPTTAEPVTTPFGTLQVERYHQLRNARDSFSTAAVSVATEAGDARLSFHLDLNDGIPSTIRAVLAVGDSSLIRLPSGNEGPQSVHIDGKSVSWLVHLRMDAATGEHAEKLEATVRDHDAPRSEKAMFMPRSSDPALSAKVEGAVQDLLDRAITSDPGYLLRIRGALLQEHLKDMEIDVGHAERSLRSAQEARDAAQAEVDAVGEALQSISGSTPAP